MADIDQEVRDLREKAGNLSSMAEIIPILENILRQNPNEFSDVNASCRFHVKDTGLIYSAKIANGVYIPLSDDEPVDVTITASDADFLALLSGKLSPMALVFGRVKIRGDLKALGAFSRFL